MRRLLHDNGFGSCFVIVTGLYGETKDQVFCSFSAFPSPVWRPDEFEPKTLGWLEKRISTWDAVWSQAQWRVELMWPWQSETWERIAPGHWKVTKTGDGIS